MKTQSTLSAIEEFGTQLETTDVIKQMLRSLKEEPARLLGAICREYQETSRPVPDHHLDVFGYLGEASITALVALGLVKKLSGERVSLFAFEPTPEGLAQYEKLKSDGFFNHRQTENRQ